LTDQTKGRCTIPSPTRARRRSPWFGWCRLSDSNGWPTAYKNSGF